MPLQKYPSNSLVDSGQLTPTLGSIADLLSIGFRLSPDIPAIEFEGVGYSRADIEERSDRLASWLLRHGANSDFLVGIYMDRSLEMLVSVVGVLKAGAAYVPLDPGFPRFRTEQIVQETHLPLLLTLARHQNDLPQSSAQVLILDTSRAELAMEPICPLPELSADTRAYVIFTSGSTGRPKGVEITHGSVVNLLSDLGPRLAMTSRDRLLAVTTLAFDISVLELLLPLVTGGTVVLASKQDISDSVRLARLIAETRATAMQATPFTWRLLLESGFVPAAGFKMMCGGEAWLPTLAEKLLRTGGRLWNMYGPTETTVWSSVSEVASGARSITIGPPIADTRFYVLNDDLRPVAPSEAGELFIAGAGLARGYFQRPDLTEERFVATFAVPEQRLYRTGDRVRVSPDGAYEFLGRVDQQIKYHGYRIELGEIDATTRTMPGVSDAVTILRKDSNSEDVLVVYFTSEVSFGTVQLRNHLQKRLPAYMVPRMFRRLEILPLTPNGKTDRKALIELDWSTVTGGPDLHSAHHAGQEHEAIQGVKIVEQSLLRMWRKIFSDEEITRESDFFELGGDSLQVLQLQSAMEKHFQVALTLADVYRHSKLQDLAAWVEETRNSADRGRKLLALNRRLVPLQSSGKGNPVFLMPQILLYETLSDELGLEQPVYALELLEGDISPNLEKASFSRLAELYCNVIREVQPNGPYRLGGWCMWGWVAYEAARIFEAQGESVEYVLVMDAWAPGYWGRHPPLRRIGIVLAQRFYRVGWIVNRLWKSDMRRRRSDVSRRLRNAFTSLSDLLSRDERPKSRVQKALSTAAITYEGGALKAKVMLFKGDHRPQGSFFEEDMGWAKLAGHPIYVSTIPGNHSEIFEPAAAKVMAEQVREALQLRPKYSPQ